MTEFRWVSEPQPVLQVWRLGVQPYVPVWLAMQRETEQLLARSRSTQVERCRSADEPEGTSFAEPACHVNPVNAAWSGLISDSDPRSTDETSARRLANAAGDAAGIKWAPAQSSAAEAGLRYGQQDPSISAVEPAKACHQAWSVEHPPTFTLGRNASREHLFDPGATPVVRIDRGGQVTMHLPGQIIVYLLLDLAALGLGVRELVTRIEEAMLSTLADFGVHAVRRDGAPGIYVGSAKIGALGLRVTRGRCLHGLALNVDPSLTAMSRMRPCGLSDTSNTSLVAELRGCGGVPSREAVRCALLRHLSHSLGLQLRSQAGLPGSLHRSLALPPGRSASVTRSARSVGRL